ncbi:hypothetical protein ACFTZK_06750 [Streptomyces decoyicus]|uniref:hypothetical protein n=1 Tax=Streptomyces decoyicus TaxID=249567 RepID=UPI00363EDC2B
MTRDLSDLTAADYLDTAHEMAVTDRPYLAHLIAEEAAQRTADPATAADIRAAYPDPTTTRPESN